MTDDLALEPVYDGQGNFVGIVPYGSVEKIGPWFDNKRIYRRPSLQELLDVVERFKCPSCHDGKVHWACIRFVR